MEKKNLVVGPITEQRPAAHRLANMMLYAVVVIVLFAIGVTLFVISVEVKHNIDEATPVATSKSTTPPIVKNAPVTAPVDNDKDPSCAATCVNAQDSAMECAGCAGDLDTKLKASEVERVAEKSKYEKVIATQKAEYEAKLDAKDRELERQLIAKETACKKAIEAKEVELAKKLDAEKQTAAKAAVVETKKKAAAEAQAKIPDCEKMIKDCVVLISSRFPGHDASWLDGQCGRIVKAKRSASLCQ